jgi:hypothetical protein
MTPMTRPRLTTNRTRKSVVAVERNRRPICRESAASGDVCPDCGGELRLLGRKRDKRDINELFDYVPNLFFGQSRRFCRSPG